MKGRADVLAQFQQDTRNHRMTVVRDEGVDRILRFRQPNCSSYWFDLVTWRGVLVINGDMGTWVFSRVEDMFTFFRASADHPNAINPGYWSEKLRGDHRNRNGSQEFSEPLFVDAVKRWHREWWHGRTESAADVAARRDCWREVVREVLDSRHDGEFAAMAAAYNFEFRRDGHRFTFRDFFEARVHDYTFHFLWCCHAIVWGIQQYDLARAAAAAPTLEPA